MYNREPDPISETVGEDLRAVCFLPLLCGLQGRSCAELYLGGGLAIQHLLWALEVVLSIKYRFSYWTGSLTE